VRRTETITATTSQEEEGMSKSWRDVLKVHPAAELLPLMPPDELNALGEDIKKNELTSPIVIWSEHGRGGEPHYLLDGRNRLDAMELVGIPVLNEEENLCVPDLHKIGGDPYSYFLSANLRRRHLTGEQKRELIAKVLRAQPGSSNRKIAELAKVDHKTVGVVRVELEGRGEFPHVETRQDSKGAPAAGPEAVADCSQQRPPSTRAGRARMDLALVERSLTRGPAQVRRKCRAAQIVQGGRA
jgi:hypothetical protein